MNRQEYINKIKEQYQGVGEQLDEIIALNSLNFFADKLLELSNEYGNEEIEAAAYELSKAITDRFRAYMAEEVQYDK